MPSGSQLVVPPASLPLSFFAAGAAGLIGFGAAVALAAPRIVASPTNSGAVAAVHVGVLAFLTVVVLGAMHQFAPVVGQRPLRSIRAGWVALVLMVLAGWMLPSGFAHGPEMLVVAGGLTGLAAVLVAAWNLSGPLASRTGGVPIVGLRIALAYLVLTVVFGVIYAIDRQTGWFPRYPHRVLSHAHLGLIGWLGIAYVAVAEKLWPMFLLAHRPSARSGAIAVGATSVGAVVLASGLLLGHRPLAIVGGAAVILGMVGHLTSLAGTIRGRRRPLELLHGFVLISAGFLVTAIVLGVAAGLADVTPQTRSRLVTAEVAALIAWISLAVVGHAHKIVPFVTYTALRNRGIRKNLAGGPLLFADLYRVRWARVTLVLTSGGFALAVGGILAGVAGLVALGGAVWAFGGAIAAWNLASGPLRVRRLVEPDPLVRGRPPLRPDADSEAVPAQGATR